MKQARLMIVFVIILGIVSRLLPHYPNFTALGAISLFAGLIAGSRTVALLIPFFCLLISDLILNNFIYAPLGSDLKEKFVFLYQGALWNYAANGLIVLVGYYLYRKQVNFVRVVMCSLIAAVIFYLVSNFGSWASTPTNPVTITSLLATYGSGLRFLVNQIAGDLFYTILLYGVLVLWYAPSVKGSLVLSKF